MRGVGRSGVDCRVGGGALAGNAELACAAADNSWPNGVEAARFSVLCCFTADRTADIRLRAVATRVNVS